MGEFNKDQSKLKLSRDRKVSPIGRDGGLARGRPRGMVAILQNSFGLPAGTSCPGRTMFCEKCYAVTNSEQAFPNVYKAMWHNYNLLKDASETEMFDLLAEAVSRYWRQAERARIEMSERVFRIHWDGDFFSLAYARAWARVIPLHPDVTFWCYTRSFRPDLNVIPELVGLSNLTLYLSVDEYNVHDAIPVLATFPKVGAAACAQDYRAGRRILQLARPWLSRATRTPSLICPENLGTIPLMTPEGRGACITCMACIRGNRDIIFSTSHVEDVNPGQERLEFPVTIGSRHA